jgi:L-ascorbate metabolism protein UlaG (beta-lactamase superfamily)
VTNAAAFANRKAPRDLRDPDRPEQREAIGDIDLLLIPVGGGPTIDGGQAAEIVAQLRPKLTIPMHFATAAVDFLEPPDEFLGAVSARVEHAGASEIETRDVLGSDGGPTVVVLEPAALARRV